MVILIIIELLKSRILIGTEGEKNVKERKTLLEGGAK